MHPDDGSDCSHQTHIFSIDGARSQERVGDGQVYNQSCCVNVQIELIFSSEERRVGEECWSKCGISWSTRAIKRNVQVTRDCHRIRLLIHHTNSPYTRSDDLMTGIA